MTGASVLIGSSAMAMASSTSAALTVLGGEAGGYDGSGLEGDQVGRLEAFIAERTASYLGLCRRVRTSVQATSNIDIMPKYGFLNAVPESTFHKPQNEKRNPGRPSGMRGSPPASRTPTTSTTPC